MSALPELTETESAAALKSAEVLGLEADFVVRTRRYQKRRWLQSLETPRERLERELSEAQERIATSLGWAEHFTEVAAGISDALARL